jgi:hypothetical protein
VIKCLPLHSGIIIVVITLTNRIISHLTILGHRVLASYDGRPLTCFGCGDRGHLYQMCPRRRNTRGNKEHQAPTSLVDIAASSHRSQGPINDEKREIADQHGDQRGLAEGPPPSDDG